MQVRQKLHLKIKQTILHLQKFMDRWWYDPLVGLLALLDNFIVVVPTDGILISSSLLRPRKWWYLSICVAIGSTAGAMLLSYFVQAHGLPWIIDMYPGITEERMWSLTENFFNQYGLYLVFAVAVTPFVQQPAVILATLAQTPALTLMLVIFSGRFIKYLLMSYIASHAPRLISKMWGVRGELDDVGIHIDKKIQTPK